MRRCLWLVVMVMALAVAPGVMVGEGHARKASTQDCLNYMKADMKDRGWVGIECDEESMRIVRVIDSSPAESAGLMKGDVILAVNGVAVGEASGSPKKMQAENMKPGLEMT